MSPRWPTVSSSSGYLNLRPIYVSQRAPYRAIVPDPGSVIPNALFTVTWHGHTAMFAQYMVGGDFDGHDHWSQESLIARYDAKAGIFRPYKPALYVWKRTDRTARRC